MTANTGTATAVNLTGNTGATIGFNGGLDIDTTSGHGFYATGGGSVNVTGSGNTVDTTTGTGVTIANTTIDAAGVTFESVNVNGALNGIMLDTTGTTGPFTVTGDGSGARNDSGGVIQNTTGHAVSLTNANGVTLQSMRIDTLNNDATHGIRSNGGSDIQLAGVTVQNLNGAGSTGWQARNLGGVNRVEGSLFTSLGVNAAIDLVNTDTNMTSFTIDDTDFTNQHGTYAATVVRILGQGTSDMGTVTVQNGSLFSGLSGDALVLGARDTASMAATISGNTFNDIDGQGIMVYSNRTGVMDVTISDNDMDDIDWDAIIVSAGYDLDLRITNNRIGQDVPVASSGSSAVGIDVLGDAHLNTQIDSNSIAVGDSTVWVVNLYAIGTGNYAPVLNATISNNAFTAPGSVGVAARHWHTVCLDMAGNSLTEYNTIDLSNSFNGTFNVTQPDLTTLSSANSGATVNTTGTIAFNQGPCALPTF